MVKGAQWLLLRSQENLSVKQEVQLQELLEANHSLTSVYVSKKGVVSQIDAA
ncbi:transposase [Aeromonas sp. QDB20]|uniref:transposase n=1 Tax=Aeromonas sp. QDB20 TaxID=2989835 RepID=UPI003FA4B244